MKDEPCPADAPSAESELNGSQHSLKSDQPISLPDAIVQLASAIDRQNVLLGQVVAQNADLISVMVGHEDGDEPSLSMDGKRIR